MRGENKLETVRAVWQLVLRYWAYNCATFFCFCIFVLTIVAFAMPWYRDHYEGNFYFPQVQNSGDFLANSTTGQPDYIYTTWSITEYYFQLDINLADAGITCKYADGVCDLGELAPYLPGLQNWNLHEYQATYSASFTFALISVIISLILMPFLQILNWKPNMFPRVVRIVLFWVLFSISIALFITLLIDWSVHLGHPRMVQQSLGFSSTYCDNYSESTHWRSGTLCSWYGHREIDSALDADKSFVPFLGVNVNKYYQDWNPRTGWQMTTVSLGVSLWVFILIVGWRPNFEQ